MARSAAQIQADIEVMRRNIERQLDAIQQRVPDSAWTPYAALALAAAVGFILAWLPFTRMIGVGARTVRTGASVGSALLAVDRFLAEHRASRAA